MKKVEIIINDDQSITININDMVSAKENNVKLSNTSLEFPSIVSFDSLLDNLITSEKYWSENTTLGIKVPIGQKENNEIVYFELGGDTADYFAMIGGRLGFGKTVLLHNIICNASILYSPLELNFYLIDAYGARFKPYNKLPHATFVSTTNREHTIKVLEHLTNEIYRRAELFKNTEDKFGSTIGKIEEYREQTGEILPRLLIIMDDFKMLFERRGYKIPDEFGFLEKIIREGRKYGIHILFCVQSRSDLDDFDISLITLRIAFNLEPLHSIKILGGNNEEAATLTKKGEAILNNRNGNIRDNIKFQCAYTNKMLDYVNFCNSKLDELQDYSPKRLEFESDVDKNYKQQ